MSDDDPHASTQPGWMPTAVPAYALADGAISRADADQLLRSRRMAAVRTLIEAARRDATALLLSWEPGVPDSRQAAAALAALITAAECEVEAAERGCGQPSGECLDPCHVGVLAPDVAVRDREPNGAD